VTHCGRIRAAENGSEFGSTTEGIKALGVWSQGALHSCYDRKLPVDGLLATAGFNGRKHESYFLARDNLGQFFFSSHNFAALINFKFPSPELVGSIFPWIEEEQTALKERIARLGRVAKDEALFYFLAFLKHLRTALLQDAAVLLSKYPGIPLFQFPPFNSEAFKSFSASSTQIIEIAESEARENLKNLPQQYAMSIQGFMKTALLKQESHQMRLEKSNLSLCEDIRQTKDFVCAFLTLQGTNCSRGVKRKAMDDLSALLEGRVKVISRIHYINYP